MKSAYSVDNSGCSQSYLLGRIVRQPQGPRKFQFLIDATGLTRFGGRSLFHQFCKSLGVRRFLQLYARWPAYPYRDYQPVDLFLAHVVAIMARIGRIENTQSLIHNGLIPRSWAWRTSRTAIRCGRSCGGSGQNI